MEEVAGFSCGFTHSQGLQALAESSSGLILGPSLSEDEGGKAIGTHLKV
jgi:hypothetical protein